MPGKPTFIVQSFEKRRGRLVPTTKDLAPTQGGALKRAEALAGQIPGAAAICVVADPETGEVSAATILGTFGEVPDDFADSLTEG